MYVKQGYIVNVKELEESIKTIKKDPKLGEYWDRIYKKIWKLIEISNEINKYVLGEIKFNNVTLWHECLFFLLEKQMADLIKKFV